eukprot:TRINITY_DN8316_c0_g2_i4.p1 TRINITY_DN8316_c0_g2~~TRINITY_DN8316_c0_g2_i4.p1  ORF type:complete len:228 (-),score=31.87 TRINITY_DN8316_c0_g2_i4:136-819(-)
MCIRDRSGGVPSPAVTAADENFERMRIQSDRHQALAVFRKLLLKQQKESKVKLDANQWIKLEFGTRLRSISRTHKTVKEDMKNERYFDTTCYGSTKKSENPSKKAFVKYSPLAYKELCFEYNNRRKIVERKSSPSKSQKLIKNFSKRPRKLAEEKSELGQSKKQRRSRLTRINSKANVLPLDIKVITLNITDPKSFPFHFSLADKLQLSCIQSFRLLESKVSRASEV